MKQPRILIFANVLDRTHGVMGFLPSWVAALQREGASVRVIAQDVGSSEGGAGAIDLMKREHPGRIRRVLRVAYLLWNLRNSYDALFVVMAPTWATLLAPIARLLGKRSYLWYAVWRGTWKLRLAELCVNGIFCSVPESFPWKSRKVHAVGQAIDIDRFLPGTLPRFSGRIVYVGRLSPVKRIEVLLDALMEFPEPPPAGSVIIAGGPLSASDREYEQVLRAKVRRCHLEQAIVWLGPVGHHEVQELYQRADVVVNMTPAGSFDKVILEAMASGSIVVASNPALLRFLPKDAAYLLMFGEGDARDFARVLSDIVSLPESEKVRIRGELRDAVQRFHSLSQWAHNILHEMA